MTTPTVVRHDKISNKFDSNGHHNQQITICYIAVLYLNCACFNIMHQMPNA